MSRSRKFLGLELALLFFGVPALLLFSDIWPANGLVIIAAATYTVIQTARNRLLSRSNFGLGVSGTCQWIILRFAAFAGLSAALVAVYSREYLLTVKLGMYFGFPTP